MKISAGWLAAAVFFAIIVVLAICGKPKPKGEYTTYDQEVMERRLKDTAKYYQDKLKDKEQADSIAFAEAAASSRAQEKILNATQEQVTIYQATVNRLRAKIEGAKLEPEDHTWVKVSPHYVDGCDSLVKVNGTLNERVDEYEEQSAEQHKLLMYEIAIRDSSLNAQKDFTRKFSNQLDECMTQLHAKAMQKPRNQLYAGVGLFGNKINPLAGGQINLSLRTKNNQIYELTGATVGNTWYGGVGTKFLITFKR